jgi:hypothetical protein
MDRAGTIRKKLRVRDGFFCDLLHVPVERSKVARRRLKMKTKTNVKAGALAANHNQSGFAVKTRVNAGALAANHNQSGFAVKTRVNAGALAANHNQSTR